MLRTYHQRNHALKLRSRVGIQSFLHPKNCESVAAMKKEADDAATAGRYAYAESLVGPYKEKKQLLKKMDLLFNLVQDLKKTPDSPTRWNLMQCGF
jgi:hypothetical protein